MMAAAASDEVLDELQPTCPARHHAQALGAGGVGVRHGALAATAGGRRRCVLGGLAGLQGPHAVGLARPDIGDHSVQIIRRLGGAGSFRSVYRRDRQIGR